MNTTHSPPPRDDDSRKLELELDEAELAALDTGEPEVVGFTSAQIRGDSLAEELGEDFIRSATSGEEDAADILDEVSEEELGGPFVESTDREEISYDTDPGDEPDAPTLRARQAAP